MAYHFISSLRTKEDKEERSEWKAHAIAMWASATITLHFIMLS